MKHRILLALSLFTAACGSTEPSAEERALAEVSVVHVDRPAAGATFFAGQSEMLTASAFDAAGVLMTAPLTFRWESSDSTVVGVEQDGRITAKRLGGASIFARLDNGMYGRLYVAVQNPADVFIVNPDSSRLLVGQQRKFVLQFRSKPDSVAADTWASSNTAVATVDANGVVTAVAPGVTTITTQFANTTFTSELYVPTTVTPLRFGSITAGDYDSCALATDGTPYCWGSSLNGALGSTERMDRCVNYVWYMAPGGSPPPHGSWSRYVSSCAMSPARVETSLRFASLTMRGRTVCGLTGAGEAYCWGATAALTGGADSPVLVPVSAQLRFANFEFPCGVTTGNEAWCFGDPALRGAPATASTTPTQVTGGATWSYVTGGGGLKHRCGLTTSGVVECWGSNSRGNLGTGDTTASPLPVPVQSTEQFSAVAVSSDESCALSTAQLLYCWGNGRTTPTALSATLHFTTFSLSSLGLCAIGTDGITYCRNSDGTMAVAVPGYAFRSLSVSLTHRCGLRDDGLAYCWGFDHDGELGIGINMEYKASPTPVVAQ